MFCDVLEPAPSRCSLSYVVDCLQCTATGLYSGLRCAAPTNAHGHSLSTSGPTLLQSNATAGVSTTLLYFYCVKTKLNIALPPSCTYIAALFHISSLSPFVRYGMWYTVSLYMIVYVMIHVMFVVDIMPTHLPQPHSIKPTYHSLT